MWLIPVHQLPGSGEAKYEIFDSTSPASRNKWILEVVEGHYIIVNNPPCSGQQLQHATCMHAVVNMQSLSTEHILLSTIV